MSNNDIKAGDSVTYNDDHEHLAIYFKYGPLKVIRIVENSLTYGGGKFVFVEFAGSEKGFYINALKKI